MNVLIATKPDDVHSISVKLALEKKGHLCMLWHTSDFPTQQKHSFDFVGNELYWHASGVDFEINNTSFDTVWFRRPQKPVMPDFLHPSDLENSQNENLALYQSFWQVIAPSAFWINPVHAIKAANCKLLQLKLAKEVGFSIPMTLVSNNPEKIKDFISSIPGSRNIFKTLYPVYWIEDQEMRLTYTQEITMKFLPSDRILQSTAGIYQKKIEKAFELRVTYFGSYYIAVKIDSQNHPKSMLDWRIAPAHELVLKEVELPIEIDQKCQQLMRKMNLVFGCFDFIVTPDNEYYFLEVNEQGQFLWIEDVNPEIKMLDVFTDFVINASSDYIWKHSSECVSLASFYEGIERMKRKLIAAHIGSGILS